MSPYAIDSAQKVIRYASLCNGIGTVNVAWKSLGWKCQWISEIEQFPIAVVDHHFGLRNLGDMTKLTEKMINGTLDLIVAGTPCQSFSVAGLRGGLDDPRGNLALRFMQLAAVLMPRWIVWENVPGVLSSKKGRDFGAVLGALEELGYGWAYRTLDAQWFGVAQRRKRVFVVGYLGDWRRAAAVLFEHGSVFGHPPTRGTVRQETPKTLGDSLARSGSTGVAGRQEREIPSCVAFHHNARGCQLPSYSRDTSIADSLTTSQGAAVAFTASERATGLGMPQGEYAPLAVDGRNQVIGKDVYHTLRVGRDSGDAVAVASSEVAGTLTASRGTGFRSNGTPVEGVAILPMAVRRLTPYEYEQLQGFPKNYTLIRFRGKPAADSLRYRALGNAMAVPVMQWIGRRIAEVDAMDAPLPFVKNGPHVWREPRDEKSEDSQPKGEIDVC